jgi:outer membrane immunogenic protein
MLKSIHKTVLLLGACALVGLPAWGQQDNGAATPSHPSIDLGVTYAAERAYIAPGNCNCFWFNGGGADVAATFWKGFGVAAALTGDHASDVTPGVDINKIAYMAGPRYTYTPSGQKAQRGLGSRWQVFGEGLFGGVHAFDSSFPAATGLRTSADSFVLQTGGGINLSFSKRLAVRVFEAAYVRTSLPNNASDVQNDLRLGFGLSYHIGSGWRR